MKDEEIGARDKEIDREAILFFAKFFALGVICFVFVLAGLSVITWVVATIVKYVLF